MACYMTPYHSVHKTSGLPVNYQCLMAFTPLPHNQCCVWNEPLVDHARMSHRPICLTFGCAHKKHILPFIFLDPWN